MDEATVLRTKLLSLRSTGTHYAQILKMYPLWAHMSYGTVLGTESIVLISSQVSRSQEPESQKDKLLEWLLVLTLFKIVYKLFIVWYVTKR